jgi:hypothetical protein
MIGLQNLIIPELVNQSARYVNSVIKTAISLF